MEHLFKFDIGVDAWIREIEIEANTEEEAKDKLFSMSLSDLIDAGYVKDFSISDIDVVEEELDDDEDDEYTEDIFDVF